MFSSMRLQPATEMAIMIANPDSDPLREAERARGIYNLFPSSDPEKGAFSSVISVIFNRKMDPFLAFLAEEMNGGKWTLSLHVLLKK